MADDDSRIPLPSVRGQGRKFLDAMADVQRLVEEAKAALKELEVYARERAGEVKGQYQSTEASRSYLDMADRIKALRGEDA